MTSPLPEAAPEVDRLACELLDMIPSRWSGAAEPPYARGQSVFAYVADRQAITWAQARGDLCALRAFPRFIGSLSLSYVADAVATLRDEGCSDPAVAVTAEQVSAVGELEVFMHGEGRFRSEFRGEFRSMLLRLALSYPSQVGVMCEGLERGLMDEAELQHMLQQTSGAPSALWSGAL